MAKKNLAALEVKVMAVLDSNNAEKEEEKMGEEMLKAWNVEDGIGMVEPGTLARLNREIVKMMKKMQEKEKPVSIDKAIKLCSRLALTPASKQLFRHPLYDIDRSYSGYAYKSLFKNEERKVVKSNNEENNMYYDAKEMAVKTLVEDFMGGKDLSILDRDFIAFNDCLVWAKICNKYPRVTNKLDIKKTDPKCFEKRMKRAEMIDQLSLRLSVLSKLGYINVDTFLNQYKNFFDACRAAKDLEHKNEVVWGIPNTQEIKTEAMKRIIQTLTETNEKLSGRDFDYNDLQMIEVE